MGRWTTGKAANKDSPRRAQVTIRYNPDTAAGSSASTEISRYLEEFVYTDPATGESDSASLRLCNMSFQWANTYLPKKGDKFTAAIGLINWTYQGELKRFECGTFCCDDRSFVFPEECTATISGTSVPEKQSFRCTTRSRTWQDITLEELARQIAGTYNLSLSYTGPSIRIGSKEQSDKDDCSFLKDLCGDYGLYIKVYRGKVIIYDAAEFEARDPVCAIDYAEVAAGSYNSTLAGTYTSAKIKYSDGNNEQEYTYTQGSGGRELTVNGKVDSLEDARIKAKAKLEEENRKAETISITAYAAGREISAGETFLFTGAYEMSGKYFVDKVTHKVSAADGYMIDIEAHKVPGATNYARKAAAGTTSLTIRR